MLLSIWVYPDVLDLSLAVGTFTLVMAVLLIELREKKEMKNVAKN